MSGVLFNSDRAALAIEYDKQMETRKWLQSMFGETEAMMAEIKMVLNSSKEAFKE